MPIYILEAEVKIQAESVEEAVVAFNYGPVGSTIGIIDHSVCCSYEQEDE